MNAPKCFWLVLVGSLVGSFALADEIIKNPSFESGAQYWRGDGKIVTLDGDNKVYEVNVGRKDKELFQQIEVPDSRKITIRFKVRALPGYEGEGVRIAFRTIKDNAGFTRRALKPGDSWQEISVNYTAKSRLDKREFAIVIKKGTGVVQFDDFRVE